MERSSPASVVSERGSSARGKRSRLRGSATVAIAFALAAAFLNAAFGFCLGCEMYLLGKRLAHR